MVWRRWEAQSKVWICRFDHPNKISYTGYLGREIPSDRNWVSPINLDDPFILVTAGGGGDGVEMVDWVIRAYEADRQQPYRAIIVTGPFMPPTEQQDFHERCEVLCECRNSKLRQSYRITHGKSDCYRRDGRLQHFL